MEDQI